MNGYFTITGTHYRFGQEFIEPGMKVTLKKEPDNEYDTEAIAVYMEGLGKIGYVANSTHTVIGECCSAGRLYDKIGDTDYGIVKYNVKESGPNHIQGVVCQLDRIDI